MAVDKKFFFDAVRTSLFGGTMTENQVAVLDGIIDSFSGPYDQMAYVMATPYHEVGPDLIPIAENLNYTSAARIRQVWPSRFPTTADAKPYVNNPEGLGNKAYGGRLGNGLNEGFRYRGRGLSQMTGKEMYAKIGKLMSVDLVGNPDLALDPKISARALVIGMRDGLFTGKKLADYSRPDGYDFVNARRVINADVAANGEKIAGYARKFRAAMRDSVGVVPAPDKPVITPDKVSNAPSKSGWTVVLAILGSIIAAIIKGMGWL